MVAQLQMQEENLVFFLKFFGVTYQNSPKTDPFSEGIMQKTKNWHFNNH